jgi:MinD superfamily P-loop ATPase
MNIAVLSGKGGTGKTTVSTNLAKVMHCHYIDTDVEEPNGHIFLQPQKCQTEPVRVLVPEVDKDKCILCGKCAQVCQFNALAKTITGIMLFEDLCHGCGACKIVCPTDAIKEVPREVGIMMTGKIDEQVFLNGTLNIKEPMAGPIISKLKASIPDAGDALIDCSPGTSCNVVKGLEGADYALLVTEPTKFGLHDLKLAVKLVQDMDIACGVVINRSDENSSMIRTYCSESGIAVIGEIPFSRKAAQIYSRGQLLVEDEAFKNVFENISLQIRACLKKKAGQAGVTCKL